MLASLNPRHQARKEVSCPSAGSHCLLLRSHHAVKGQKQCREIEVHAQHVQVYRERERERETSSDGALARAGRSDDSPIQKHRPAETTTLCRRAGDDGALPHEKGDEPSAIASSQVSGAGKVQAAAHAGDFHCGRHGYRPCPGPR